MEKANNVRIDQDAVSCTCDEGFITVYTPDGKHVQRYDRTGLAMHDCSYIKWRNSKIPEAEAICKRRGFAPEGLFFLQVMDGLCRVKDSNVVEMFAQAAVAP